MSFKELQEIFESDNVIKFKLYSLKYVIELVDNIIVAYAVDYSERKEKFNSLKEAMNNFKIYSEPLMNQLDKICIVNKGDD